MGNCSCLGCVLTGHDGLKVGQAEHTAVSQVVRTRGCKREKPEISIHGDREAWWRQLMGTKRYGSHTPWLVGRRGLLQYLLPHWSVVTPASHPPFPAQLPPDIEQVLCNICWTDLIFFFFLQFWGWNPGPCTFWAQSLSLNCILSHQRWILSSPGALHRTKLGRGGGNSAPQPLSLVVT
jgi:hypothetical protein